MLLVLRHLIMLAGLTFGTVTDLKSREVPDWLNYSLIVSGIGLAGIEAISLQNWQPFLASLAGLVIGMAIGFLMYYAGQWGGGDAKLIMGLGALWGFDVMAGWHVATLSPLLLYLAHLLLVGAVYGLVWAVAMGIIHHKKLLVTWKKQLVGVRKLRIAVLASVAVLILIAVLMKPLTIRIATFGIAALLFLLFHLWQLTKAVESSCMIKELPTSKLTEGDWIVNEVKHKGKLIVGPKDLGITREQIDKLKKYRIKNVTVKEGIPFVPSFLIAHLITIALGNWFLLL